MKINKRKLARIQKGMTQLELALATGVSPALISLYEMEAKSPSPELARKLNNLLGKNIYEETE